MISLILGKEVEKILLREMSENKRNHPFVIPGDRSDIVEDIIFYSIPRAYLITLNDVEICQYYLFSGRKLLADLCLPNQLRQSASTAKQFLKKTLFRRKRVAQGIWVTDLWSKNYFHWLLEALPRLIKLRALGYERPVLMFNHVYNSSYIEESIHDLGFEVITYDQRTTLAVKELLVLSHDPPCVFDSIYLESVRDFYMDHDNPRDKQPSRYIYISRSRAHSRKVLNEPLLKDLLKDFGFEIIFTEDMSFCDQRSLMRDCKLLLSSHGAGLANGLFMSQGAQIIELHPDTERYNSCFFHMADALKLKYTVIFEEATTLNPQKANIKVDLPRLEKILNEIKKG